MRELAGKLAIVASVIRFKIMFVTGNEEVVYAEKFEPDSTGDFVDFFAESGDRVLRIRAQEVRRVVRYDERR